MKLILLIIFNEQSVSYLQKTFGMLFRIITLTTYVKIIYTDKIIGDRSSN